MRFVPLALLLLSLCAELVGAQVVPFTTIPVGNAPGTVLVANGLVWTVDFGSNTVSVIDPVTWTKLEDVPTGAGPRAIVLDDVYKKLYVANAAGDSVTVIDAVTRSVVKTIALPAGSDPWHLKFFQSRVYVVLHGSNRLAIIHTYYDTVEASFATGVDPRQVCVESFGHLYAYVVNFGSNNVTVIDVVAGAEAPGSPVAVGLGPNSCADGGGTYVANETSGTVSLIYDKTVHDTYVTGPQPSMLTGDGRVIIGNAGSGSVSVVGIVSGVRQIVATIPTGVDPSAALVDVKAEAMYVVNRGSDTVSVIDLHDYTVKQQVPLGTAPQGIVRHAENLFAANSGDGSVSVYKRFDFRHFYDDERLVWHNATTKQIAAWQMQGIAAVDAVLFPSSGNWVPVGALEIYSSGSERISDLLLRDAVSGATGIWLMNRITPVGLAPDTVAGSGSYVPIGTTACNVLYFSECIVWREAWSGDVAYWFMGLSSSAPFYSQTVYSGGPAWMQPITGDFDGDGIPDLLWQHADGRIAMWMMTGEVRMTYGPGVGWFTQDRFEAKDAAYMLGPATGWVPERVADFDADGRSDILWRHATTGDTAIWLMNGLTLKDAAIIFPGSAGWTVTHVRDLDGDGKADLLWRHTSGATAAWLMDGVAAKSGTVLLADPNWSITHTRDTNHDLKGDLLWRHSVTGQTALWTMDGLTPTASAIIFTEANWTVVPTE